MKRIVVTPTFRPHFPFNRDFLQSYAEHVQDAAQFPVHFIVTRDELADMQALIAEFPALELHAHAFEDFLEASGHREDPTKLLREVGKFAYQSLKKLYALKEIDYDQALLLDSEALILKPVRLAEVFDEYYADPFVLYSDFSHRGELWFGGQSDAVVKNAAKLLRVPYPKLWFLEYYGWFYDKQIVRDLFATFQSDLLPAVRSRLKDDTRLFENQLFYHFIWLNADRYNYRFESVQDMLQEYLDPDAYRAYMRHFEGAFQQTGLFEMVSKTVTERNRPALERLFNDKRFRFYRFELLNRNADAQRELIERTPITFLVSSEGYRRTRERVAVCLSGMPRHPRQNVRFLRSFLAESNVDVFFHFWEGGEDDEYIVGELAPKAYLFEPSDAAPPPPEYKRAEKLIPARRAPDVTSMFYSIKRANDLKRAYEEEQGFRYDIVVRLRLDFFSTRPLVDIIEHIRDQQAGWERTLYVPDMAHSSGINDQFALGTSETMDVYTSVFDHLSKFADNDYFNAEYMVARNALRGGLRIRTFPFEYVLLRNDVVQTFDLAAQVRRMERTWFTAQLPPIPGDALNAYFGAKLDSVALIDEFALEFPKVFRLRSAEGYLAYVAATRKLALVPDVGASSLFFLIIAGDDDRTAINIRPRELVLATGATRESRATSCNLYPDASGAVRPDGPADEDSAFFIARKGDGFVFEWCAGFWKTPADPRGIEMRLPGGGRPIPTPMHTRERLSLQTTGGAVALRPLDAQGQGFVIERVVDAEAESLEMGLDVNAPDRVRVTTDPLPLRLWYLSYLAARTLNQRGAGAAKEAVSTFIRKRAHRAEQTNARGVLSTITRRLAKRL